MNTNWQPQYWIYYDKYRSYVPYDIFERSEPLSETDLSVRKQKCDTLYNFLYILLQFSYFRIIHEEQFRSLNKY